RIFVPQQLCVSKIGGFALAKDIELVSYPLVIDPSVNWLEVALRRRSEGSAVDAAATYWTTLKRLPQRWNYPLPFDNRTPHLFGNSERLGQCDCILAYDATGSHEAIFYRRGGECLREDAPEERSGVVRLR